MGSRGVYHDGWFAGAEVFVRVDNLLDAANEHEQLLELLRRGAMVEAVACVRLQIERSRERIQRALVEGRIDVSAI